MATLSVTIGPVTGTLNFDNVKGAAIIDSYIQAYNGPITGTNQGKMDWFIQHLADHVRQVHLGRVAQEAAEQAKIDATANSVNWN